MKKRILPCPTCRKKFVKIADLNKHISKTGCNDRKKIKITDYLGLDSKMAQLIEQLLEL